MCVDSHTIIKITIKYSFPMRHFEDLMDKLAGAVIFSKLDLKSEYHQIVFIQKMSGKLHLRRDRAYMSGR